MAEVIFRRSSLRPWCSRTLFVGASIRFATNELDYNPLVDECSRVSDARGDILAGLE
jgi:hypothetical protein